MKRVELMMVGVVALLAVACGRSEAPATSEAPASQPAAQSPAGPQALNADWTVTEGIATPESVYYDEASGSIFVSQIDGAPDGKDGNGRIVRLDANGKMVNANFVTGLNAPKGLRVVNGTLWAADLGEAVAVDVASGKITRRVPLEGAMFPNDVAGGADGTVYISDMMGNKIYAVRDGKASVFVEGEQLEHPNGILVEGDRLVVGGWGGPQIKPDFSTETPGHLFAIDLKTKQKTLITQQPIANIDGVESDGQGGYVITDYLKGQVIRVRNGQAQPVAQFPAGTADIGWMAGHNMVIVPHMNENKVAAYTLR